MKELLLEKYPQEIRVTSWPNTLPEQKRSAVMPLCTWHSGSRTMLPSQSMTEIAEILEVTPTEVASIVGFYTLYHAEPGGKYRLQVCTDLPCALRGADDFLQNLCANLGIQLGETTPDGLISIEAVMCLAGCDRAPMFQVQDGMG